jgi:uncharacterized protein (DUF58 family)
MSLRHPRLRPARIPRRGLGLLGLDGALMLVSRASGAGWVVVVFCAVTAVLVVATVWPAVTLLRTRVDLLVSPRDATAGSPAIFSVLVRRPGPGVRLRLIVGGREGAWVAAFGTCQGDVIAVPPKRGVLTRLTVDVEAAGPVGLVPWKRRITLSLAPPMDVGPAPTAVALDEFVGVGAGVADGIDRGVVGHDTVRGVRAYLTGDPIRLVHWPASARWGELMVKEMDDPTAADLVIVVDLRGRPDRVEEAASVAAGLAGAGLQIGLAVSLLTAEAGGPHTGPVSTPVEAGRRLARAVAGAPPPEPRQGASKVIRVTAQ